MMSEKVQPSVNQPLLTIAIPTYNGSRTIKVMLDILLPQIDNRVEIIVIDNCSTDDTPKIIKEYGVKYNMIKYIRNEKNIGADGNFLKCMCVASGRYIHILSDDDVLTEGTLKKVLDFLQQNQDMGLVFLGTANFYSHYTSKDKCVLPIALPESNICTTDKKLFMEYAKHYWGFVSSFIISKVRFCGIDNPQQYFGTYWLQGYIHILCASGKDTLLGIVEGLCIAAGVYITQSNYDTGFVDGISYKRLLDCAIQNGFDKKQLDKWFEDRICLLGSHGIIKEKATGKKRINNKQLFACTKKYPKAWIKIYPMWLVPRFVCRYYMEYYRKRKGADYGSTLNRDGDVSTTTVK